ncbi:hypothetical protein [Natrarchaeobius oligotrophus]|uniref:hypothetical protein n=1 Tax=Natrarchaeobius oligotrophus TaxID=3455743 RepID=UPI0014044BA9|nr:hypothetical protein [Natrarchaeobius chitinivorans]
MDDEPDTRIDHPKRLCDAIVELIDEIEESEVIGEEKASELRSEIYRSIDVAEE